jgi:hypothetical protein
VELKAQQLEKVEKLKYNLDINFCDPKSTIYLTELQSENTNWYIRINWSFYPNNPTKWYQIAFKKR